MELRKRQIMFERAEQLGRIAHWEWDEVEDRLTSCSPEYVNIYGQSTVEALMDGDNLQYVHPLVRGPGLGVSGPGAL